MERIGLVPTFRAAFGTWNSQRRHSRILRWWMAGGRASFPTVPGRDRVPSPGPWGLLPNLLRCWVGQGIDELLIAPRTLFGVPELERDPAFWKPDGDMLVAERLHRLMGGGQEPNTACGVKVHPYGLGVRFDYQDRS